MSNNICQSVQSLSSSLAMRRMFSRAAFAAILFGTNSFACTSSCFFGFRSQDSSRGKRCWIGRSKKDFPALSRTARTTSSFPLIIWSTTPSFHLFLFLSSPLIITTSPCFRSWSLVLCVQIVAFTQSSEIFLRPPLPQCILASFDVFRSFPEDHIIDISNLFFRNYTRLTKHQAVGGENWHLDVLFDVA